MPTWEEITDEFDAVSEDGQSFRVVIYTTMIDASSPDNPNAEPIEGMKRYCTTNGQECSRIDGDTFEIVGLGLRIRRSV